MPRYRKTITLDDLEEISDIFQQDDVITTSHLGIKHTKANGRFPIFRRPVTLRFARVTNVYVRALFAYINMPLRLFQFLTNDQNGAYFFEHDYSAYRTEGKMQTYRATIFWIVKLLYHERMIPYGLARLAGVIDEVSEGLERERIARLISYHQKIRKGQKRSENKSTYESSKITFGPEELL